MLPFRSQLTSPEVENILQSLSLRQRIAQLIHVSAWSNKDEDHYQEIDKLVKEYGIGGIIFFQGTPTKQAELTNRYQALSNIPLMMSIDAEWGLAMRLEDSMAFPYSVTLGALPESHIGLIEEMGYEIGLQCRRLGIHVNFAPVADINTQPHNPVIGFRSFGREKEQVALRAAAYARGLTRARVLPVAKHFPGHGDTDTDSHLTLPVIKHTRERLNDVELYPFRQLIEQGVGGVMPGHIHVPALDDTPNRGASLSPAITSQLLQQELGFEGLVFTDALNMKGVSDYFKPGELEVEAFKAGNDVLLCCEDAPAAIDAIEAAIQQGEIDEDWLNARVRKQLAVKAWLHISKEPISQDHLHEDLHSASAQDLNHELHLASLQMAHAYPHDIQRKGKVAAIAFQAEAPLDFHKPLEGVDCLYWTKEQDLHWGVILETLAGYEQVIVSVHSDEMKASQDFGLDVLVRERVYELLHALPATLVLFAHPITWPSLVGEERIPTVFAWQNSPEAQLAASGLF